MLCMVNLAPSTPTTDRQQMAIPCAFPRTHAEGLRNRIVNAIAAKYRPLRRIRCKKGRHCCISGESAPCDQG
jgi:hypothetical protein